jgi:hypothetical protein
MNTSSTHCRGLLKLGFVNMQLRKNRQVTIPKNVSAYLPIIVSNLMRSPELAAVM